MRRHLAPILALLVLAALPAAAHTRAALQLNKSLPSSLETEPEIALPAIVTEAEDRLEIFPANRKLASGIFCFVVEPNIRETQELGGKSWQGHDYMHARYFSPNFARFLSVDPGPSAEVTRPQSWNRYAYASNNPVNRIDPDGRVDGEAMLAELKRLVHSILPSAKNPIVLDPVNRPLETAANMVVIGTLVSPIAGDEVAGTATVATVRRVTSGRATVAAVDAAESTRLFRAVGPNEGASIAKTGGFGASPNGSEVKGFFFGKTDAEAYKKGIEQITGKQHTVVGATAPKALVESSPAHAAAGEGKGVYIRNEDLEKLILIK